MYMYIIIFVDHVIFSPPSKVNLAPSVFYKWHLVVLLCPLLYHEKGLPFYPSLPLLPPARINWTGKF